MKFNKLYEAVLNEDDDKKELKKYGIKKLVGEETSLDNIKKYFPWLLKAKIKDAVIMVTPESLYDGKPELKWFDGTWIKGVWENGIFSGGTWKDGTWKNGVLNNATWKNGTWEDGKWLNGDWENGEWLNGEWLNGIWENGNWENGKWSRGWWKSGTINGVHSDNPPTYN